jgi:hypothetical protein
MKFFPYFELVARPGIGGVDSPAHGRVRFRQLTAERAVRLWADGFPYLRLTKEGARHFFADLTAEQRIPLLERCATPLEVEALLKLPRTNATLKRAANERLAQLAPEAPPAE